MFENIIRQRLATKLMNYCNKIQKNNYIVAKNHFLQFKYNLNAIKIMKVQTYE